MKATLSVLGSLLRGGRGASHAERLDSFYDQQAEHYDTSRRKLLHGRADLVTRLPLEPGAHLIEMGGGTGSNLELFGERLRQARKVELVDLCRPLLTQAERRCTREGWNNVELVHADATTWTSPHGQADLVLCAYSLSMIPDWWAAVDNALRLLKPGGTLAVVDFFISRKHPAPSRVRHGWCTRSLWPLVFAHDGVHLRPDLLPYLESKARTWLIEERRGGSPWLPGARIPYLLWAGTVPG